MHKWSSWIDFQLVAALSAREEQRGKGRGRGEAERIFSSREPPKHVSDRMLEECFGEDFVFGVSRAFWNYVPLTCDATKSGGGMRAPTPTGRKAG